MNLAPFTPAWRAGSPAATAFLGRGHRDPAGRRAAVEAAQRRPLDRRLAPALQGERAAQRCAREALLQGAVCVVTGQQAGLFGGPLYTLYKAAAAIAAARTLRDEFGVPCVPVFWLQNEDHDYAEIDHCHLVAGDEVRRVAVPGPDDRRSICARRFGDGIDAALGAVADALAGRSEADDVLALLREHYTAAASPDQALVGLLHAWFGAAGLLVFDPSHPAARAAAAPVHARAVREARPIAAALTERVAALREAGFEAQVHVRPDAPLSFFHPAGFGGPRHRLEPRGEGFELVGTEQQVSVEEALTGAKTTSALLRPLVQDLLLPTAAYVGGPGEIAYFAQLAPLYAHFERALPLVALRARFAVVDGTSQRLLDQLGLSLAEVSEDRATLAARVARTGDRRDPQAALEALLEGYRAPLEALAADATDLGLDKQIEKADASARHAFERLVERYQQAIVRDDEVALARLDRLLARLQPNGAPQERVLSWPSFAARCPDFVERVLAAVRPFDGELRALTL